MEVISSLQATAAFTSGKEPPPPRYPLDRNRGRRDRHAGRGGEERNI
jgi:hypothetical protein